MPNAPTDFLRRLEEFADDTAHDLERVQQELREIDVLIRQSTAEVERLAQRKIQIDTKVRLMEANLEGTPREDIRALYTAAQEAQLRLFMMRSQVEQLQSKQRTLEKYAQDLQRFLELSRFTPRELALLENGRPSSHDSPAASNSSITRIIEAQESERLRLSRQMHDGPAQSLTNLILQAEICERLFDSDPQRARAELVNLKNAVNSTFQKVRDFILDLRPMMLDDLGLVPTLKRYVDTHQSKVDFQINLQILGEERRLPAPVEITLFRATQELLQNVARHARAQQAHIQLDLYGPDVTLVVEDDGSGFNVAEALGPEVQRRAIGLTALQERVEMLGGELQIESSIGRGTRVCVRAPAAEGAVQ